jgi:hypothetical protein
MPLRRSTLFALCAAAASACAFPTVEYFDGGNDASISDAVVASDAPSAPDTRTSIDAPTLPADAATSADVAMMTPDVTASADAPTMTPDVATSADAAMMAPDGTTSADAPMMTPDAATSADADASRTDAASESESSTPYDASADAGDVADGRMSNDSSAVDAPVLDAAADTFTCDFDGDKHNAKGAVCGGGDCDDHDPRAYDGEPNYLTDMPQPPTNGDWDCDGTVEQEFPVGVQCTGIAIGAGCNGTKGFTEASVGCGQMGTLVQCTSTLVLCQVGSTMTAPQGCK